MNKSFAAFVSLALTVATSGQAKAPELLLPEPSEKPDWMKVRAESEAAIKATLVDPYSARIRWVQGFRWGVWGTTKQRSPAWTACGVVNAKNRMGGYTGESVFIVAYNGGVLASKLEGPGHDYVSQMCWKTNAPLQSELVASTASTAPIITNSLADEIEKLGALRDKGLLTQTEFEAEKVKLLNR